MAKKKKIAADNPNIVEQLAAYSPPWFDNDEKKEDKAENEQVKTLTEQLARVTGELDSFKKQQMFSQFKGQGHDVQEKKKVDFNLADLPDPVTHKEDHAKALIERVMQYSDQRIADAQAQGAAQQEQQKLVDDLWAGFKEAHPTWGKHEMLVDSASRRVSANMLSRGIDVRSLMRQAPEMYYQEVVGMLEKTYPQLKEEADDDEGDEDKGSVDGPSRTAGVFGGSPGKASNAAAQENGETSGMLRDLAELRFKAGVR